MLPLHRAGDQAAHVIALKGDVNDYARDHGNDGAGDEYTIIDPPVRVAGLDVYEGDGKSVDRIICGEGQGAQELRPGEEEGIRDGRGDARDNQRVAVPG